MGSISLQIPQVGQPDSTEDPKIASDLTTIQAVINGNIDPVNLSSATSNTWLRLVSAGVVAIAYGQGTVTWPGGSPTTSSVTITHGLGRSPAALTVTGNTGTFVIAWATTNRGTTTFQVVGFTADSSQPSGGTTQTFDWIAIG